MTAPTDRQLKHNRLKVVASITAIIAVTILLLLLVMIFGSRLGGRYTPMLDVALHVRIMSTSAHLWLEEIVSGDEGENIEQVWSFMDSATQEVDKLLSGETLSDFKQSPTLDDQMRDLFTQLRDRLTMFRQLAIERYLAIELSGVGTPSDQKFDKIYQEIIGMTELIEKILESYVAKNLALFQKLLVVILLGSVGFLFFLVRLTNTHFKRLGTEIEIRRLSEENLRLSEKAAIDARDEAQAANSAKDLFLAKVSHEIRTPLNSITGMATMLGDTGLTPEQSEYLQILDREANDLATIVSDLLDFSKIEANHVTLSPEVFDLRQMVADAVEMHAVKAYDKGLLLDLVLAPELPTGVIADQLRVRQILLNLLRNAVKFTEVGSITVGISADPVTGNEPRANIKLKVMDTGIGVRKSMHRKIFHSFTQAGGDASRAEGLGLGLTICRELTAIMGGTIELESEVGHGSIFTVNLNLPIVGKPPPPPDTPPPGVLLADCDDSARDYTLDLLRRAGIEPHVVDDISLNPAAVVDTAMANPAIDTLVLSDRLAGTERIAALEKAIQAASDNAINVVVLCFNPTPLLTKRYRDAGASAVFCHVQRALRLIPVLYNLDADLAPDFASDSAQIVRKRYHLNVLVVDDHPVTQIALRHMLNSLGCQVSLARTASEALHTWQQGAFDLILLDTQLPDFDGPEVAQRIRELERVAGTPPVPIVASTANASPEHRIVCFEAGMNRHLPKPIHRESLLALLDDLFTPTEQSTPS